jgi:predicted Zn-dependent protease
MSAPASHAAARTDREGHDRKAAARLLAVARTARGDETDEAVEWAYSAVPDSLGATRLKIQMLLRQGNLEAVDTLVAQGLLQRPTNASLSYLRARSLFSQDRLAAAGQELRLVFTSSSKPSEGAPTTTSGGSWSRRGSARADPTWPGK